MRSENQLRTIPITTLEPASTLMPSHRRRAAAWFVLVTVFLDVMAIGMMLPALPKLVEAFVPGDTAQAARVFGLFGMAWGLMQFIGAPILGALSDRYGRRPVILFSNLGLGLDYVLMALAPNLEVVFVGRLIAGVASASFATAFAYITDITAESERAGEFGKIGAVFGLGFIVGPAVGGMLAGIDHRLPFWVAAALSLLNFGYGYFVLPESLAPDRRTGFTWKRANPYGAMRLLLRSRRLLGLATVGFLDTLALISLPSTFVLYATHKFGWTDQTVGWTFAATGIGLAIGHAALTRPMVAWLGERGTLLVGLVFGIAGFSLYGMSWSSAVVWSAIPLIAMWGLAESAMQSLMSTEVAPGEQGQLQGALASSVALAETLGPLLFTQVYALAITTGAGFMPSGSPYLVAAVMQVLAIVIAYVSTRPAAPKSPR